MIQADQTGITKEVEEEKEVETGTRATGRVETPTHGETTKEAVAGGTRIRNGIPNLTGMIRKENGNSQAVQELLRRVLMLLLLKISASKKASIASP